VASLDLYRDGNTIHMLVGQQRDESSSLWHRRSDDGGATWSTPVRVDGAVPPGSMRRGDDAQIVANGNAVVAVWSIRGTGWGGSGPLSSAVSRDGGRSWSPGGNPSDNGLTTGHGFVDLLADREGLHAVWIDARDKAQGVRYSRSMDGLKWTPNVTVASGSCECCWNTLVSRGYVQHVLFRGKEPRDMALATRSEGRWRRNGQVGTFNWDVKGCPETGGGLASTSDGQLHALVWTGQEGKAGLYALRANPQLEWTEPRRIGTEQAQHGDLAAEGRRVAVVWDENDAIYAALSNDEGTIWSAPRRLSANGVRATHPRIVAAGDGFLAAWTQAPEAGNWIVESRRVQPD
jgi:hypothetical protein